MHNGPTLEVNLAAIVRNWRRLAAKLASGTCAAVVKADAYGLGVGPVAHALADAGCTDFFVATLEEGITLRRILSEGDWPLATIFVFHGARKSEIRDFIAHGLIPVINSWHQCGDWDNAGACALHIDTGMNRLGMNAHEIDYLKLTSYNVVLVMSHLSCGNEPEHPMNKRQLTEFRMAMDRFSGITASLANSSGIFLGPDYHFDLARPGCSLYGISPNTALPNPMENVVRLSAPVLQYRRMQEAGTVGYGATAEVPADSILATVEMGYADGFLRALSNKVDGFVAGTRVPLVGRVSMDMLIFDISAVPMEQRTADLRVTLIGAEQPVDVVAEAAGTIGYEVLSRIGSRVKRFYQ